MSFWVENKEEATELEKKKMELTLSVLKWNRTP